MEEKQQQASSFENILKDASKKKSSVFSFSKTYPAYIVLIITLLLSFFVWKVAGDKVQNDRKLSYEKATSSILQRIETKQERNEEVHKSMRGLYDLVVQVVNDYFFLYGSVPTKTYPSIISISYAPKVERSKLDTFIYSAMSRGYFDYEIYPESNYDNMFPVLQIVPFEENYDRLGYDYGTDKYIRSMIDLSRDSNITTSTPFYHVRPDTLGFYMISPIYTKDSARTNVEERQANFDALLLLEINSDLFFKNALGNGIPSDTSVIFKVVDELSDGTEKVVYKSENYDWFPADYKPFIESEEHFYIANRKIKVHFATIPNYGGQLQSFLPLIALGVSLIISIAFFGFLLSIFTSRARAMDLAERMTRSQRRIVDTSKDIIAVLDFNGVWQSMNPACYDIFGYEPEELTGQKIDILFDEGNDISQFYSMIQPGEAEYTDRIDIEMKSKSMENKWINWSFTVSNVDGLVYAIGRDVTLEKIAEAQAQLRSKQIRLAEQYAREASETKTFFMTKLSHQLRNSLTGIIGYLQLLSARVFETEEEHDTYIRMAEESSEEIFTFVSDIVDAALGTDEDKQAEISTVKVGDAIDKSKEILKDILEDGQTIDIELMDEARNATVMVDFNIMSENLAYLFAALASGMTKCEIQVTAEDNPHESATEVQILGAGNKLVEDMIQAYKYNMSNLIDALKVDTDDVVLRLAIAASNFRRMSGNMTVETFGNEEGNIIMITLPGQKQLS